MPRRVECSHPSCHCSFDSKAFMLQHLRDRHSLSSAPASQSQSQSHSTHIVSRPLASRVECRYPSCHRSFESRDSMLQHHRDAHELNRLHTSVVAAYHERAASALLVQHGTKDNDGVACNDCGRLFGSIDSLHQHQWDSHNHTRVSKSCIPNPGSCVRDCSQCGASFNSAADLERHFTDQHPISELSRHSEEGTWQYVEGRFRSAWKNPSKELIKVHRIFKVYNTGQRRKSFEQYRKQLKKKIIFDQKLDNQLELRNKVLHDGNELLRYHGTTVKCRLGQPPNPNTRIREMASLCASAECSLCRILQIGFKKSKCREERFQRFGKGIYTSSISSKAHGYVKCPYDAKENNYKVMIVCKVLAGRPYHSTHNAELLISLPGGFHSVQGNPGIVLNYDELVVYDDHAILPAFIILYSSTG